MKIKKVSQPVAMVEKIESGTWTPVLKCRNGEQAPTYTASSVSANYRKIGDLVYIDFYIRGQITALNGTDNYIKIEGLPFPAIADGFGQQTLAIGVVYDITSIDSNENKTMPILTEEDEPGIVLQGNDGAYAASYRVTTAQYFEIAGNGFYKANVN